MRSEKDGIGLLAKLELYIYSSSKLNFLHNVEMADIGSKNAHLFFFWPAAFVILFLVSSY